MSKYFRWHWLGCLLLVFAVAGCTGEDSEDHEHDHDDHLEVSEEEKAEAWTCPMHPEVMKDEPGSCPECGMDLVPAEVVDEHAHGEEHEHDHEHEQDHDHDHAENGEAYYTCPMHPDVRQDEPGTCPICGMDLVPAEEADDHDHDDMDDMDVHVPAGIQQAMNIRTATAEMDQVHRHIETMGRVRFDQSRLRHYHLRGEGWIQELEVDTVGDRVEVGDLLYTLYSPELVNAQEEYLQALRRGNPDVIAATEERLEALDIQASVIEEIRETRELIRFIPWHAQESGEVTALGAREGQFIEPGTEILELADLDRLWVQAEVFGAQSDWLETGQHAEVSLAYRPGERRDGEISHIYPELDEFTRTVRARIALDNPGTRFRPGMWTAITIHAGDSDEHVFVPLEALIRTGRDARIVVREHDEHFVVRHVEPGEVSGERVAILDGLAEGEEVVTSGQFLIDSEASLRGGHGRMEHDH